MSKSSMSDKALFNAANVIRSYGFLDQSNRTYHTPSADFSVEGVIFLLFFRSRWPFPSSG